MRRRTLLALLGGAAAAQQFAYAAGADPSSRILRVGRLAAVPRSSPGWAAFERRLAELGYHEERNLRLEFAGGEFAGGGSTLAEYSAGAIELIRRDVDVIVAGGPEMALTAAVQATRTIPIVMVAIDYDPVGLGYVSGLARPGGNVTGVFFQQLELAGKRTELVKEAVPHLARAALLWDAISADQIKAAELAAASLGITTVPTELRNPPYDYQAALSQIGGAPAEALVVLSSPFFFRDRSSLAETALRYRLPLVSPFREMTEAGALLSYGASVPHMYRRAAEYVDQLYKGAKPADLPVEQPTKFELVINLKTAKALGLTVPQALLARADEVIE